MNIHRFQAGQWSEVDDFISQELPLEIMIKYGPPSERTTITLSINMRTQGHDKDLVLGFLLTEGIISSVREISLIKYLDRSPEEKDNRILVELDSSIKIDTEKLQRHIYTNSSCGVCAKTSIESVFQLSPYLLAPNQPTIRTEEIISLPEKLYEAQKSFQQTGGIHATGIFSVEKGLKLELIREDVGRHNAMDKAIGAMLQQSSCPFKSHIALVSGRASFELVQKCIMVGIPIICAIGAPSTLAVELAQDADMTLVGFLRKNRFNVYSGIQRIIKE